MNDDTYEPFHLPYRYLACSLYHGSLPPPPTPCPPKVVLKPLLLNNLNQTNTIISRGL